MADDLKTMSGFVMGLLDRMDEEDKVKGFVPPINIPPPTGGYEYSPNIQKIIDKGQKSFTQRALHDMYKRSGEDPGVQDYLVETYGFKPYEEPRSLFSSDPERMKMFFGDSDKIVPEPKDLNIPKESTPPIVPEKQVPSQDGEGNVPPVQAVPVSESVPKLDTPEETIKEVTLVDDGLDQEYAIPFSEVERIVNRASQFEFGGKKPDDDTLRYLYDSSGRDPRVLDAFKSKYQYEFKEKDSAGGFRPLITKIEQNIEEGKRKRLEEQEKYNEFVRGQRVDRLTQQAEDLGFDLVSKDVPPVDGAGIPKKDDAATQAGIDNIIKGMEEEQKQLSQQSGTDSNVQVTQVTQEDVKESSSQLNNDTKDLVNQNLNNANLNGDGKGGKVGEGDKVDPEPGFFKSIWNAIKDIAKDGFEDPSLRKALFAYTASRVLGYDGVTLAASVLENEWQKQAAATKADRELEIAVGKKQAEAIKDQRMDYTTSKTMYDPRAKKNYSGFMNKTGDFEFAEEVILPYLNDKDEMVMTRFPAGSTLPVTYLTKLGYSVGEGDTIQDITSSYTKYAKDQAARYLKNYYASSDFTDLKEAQRKAIEAQADNLVDDASINEAISVVRSTLPAGSFEKDNSDFRNAVDQGMEDVVKAMTSGRSVDNAYLAAAIIEKKLTLDKDIKIKPYDFKFNPSIEQFKDYEDSKIGLNSLTRVMFSLKSPAADLGVDEFKILSHLSEKYSNLDSKMKDEYISFAVNSLEDDNATQEAVTPFMSYVLKKLDDDNLSATLKDLRDHFKSK